MFGVHVTIQQPEHACMLEYTYHVWHAIICT